MERGEGLEMELIIDHTYGIKPPLKIVIIWSSESFQVGEHTKMFDEWALERIGQP